ncbi:MAG: acetoacetate decarboxylase family protein [Candidatus Rokubacteria bacterium]|nr:acetoacetate decarboxylase family protein [Candidatus Rokubacteria bacterium]
MPLPRYVDRGGEIVAPGPYTARGAETYAFILPADRTRLNALLAKSFRGPSGGAVDVEALAPIVFLTASRIRSLRPTNSPQYGQASEREIAVWVPGRRMGHDRMVWFHPYMFVDQHLALAAGREVYGFPKQGGDIAIHGPATSPDAITLDVVAIDRFHEDAWATPHRVLEIVRRGAPSPPPIETSNEAAALDAFEASMAVPDMRPAVAGLRGIGDIAGLLALIVTIVRETAAGRMPMVFLKQFRDAADPGRACYQAIIEARTRRLAFHGFGFLGDYRVTVNDLASEPIRADLGLPQGTIEPIQSIRLQDDFEMETGRVLWP